jgi:CubicO group peptidase (beta-lactamase class C family)
MEWLFNFHELTPEDAVAALAGFEFFTDFGEAFQYSNQMVATAGYIAGQVAEGSSGDLLGGYAAALQSRVLEPIGMLSTTLSFDQVLAEGGYAVPHTRMLDNSYEPMPLDFERSLVAIAPAGAHWSTLEDMARYMIVQLAGGVAPGGLPVVSPVNLDVTRQPQIAVNAGTSYGLGWMVTSYGGQPMITHSGNTAGFTAEFTFLPDAGLGVIVLTNARASSQFNSSVAARLLELVFEQEPQVERELDFALQQMSGQAADLLAKIEDSVDPAAVQPYLGAYHSPLLGDAELTLQDGALLLDIGEFVAELRPYSDPDRQFRGYIQVSPPTQGLLYRLEEGGDGRPQVVLVLNAEQYVFTRR